MATPAEGKKAPTFALPDQNAETVKLAGFKGRRVLVYFYPKADTPGCTVQACGLRDIAGDIGDTAILGISPDLPAKQLKFDEKYSLGFPLLSDPDSSIIRSFGTRSSTRARPGATSSSATRWPAPLPSSCASACPARAT